MNAQERIIAARERRAKGMCIANPRPIGCKVVVPRGEAFCGYCRRLIENKPATISRDRARRAA